MKYYFLLIIFFNIFCSNYIYSFESYVVLKVNNKIITNVDIDNEYRYLIALNTDLQNIDKKKVMNIAKDSIIREKIKEDELLKWVEYLERYYEVSTIEGNLTSKRLSKKDLEDAYQKYEKNLGKLRKRTVNVIDILATLSNATNDAESGSQVNLPSSA